MKQLKFLGRGSAFNVKEGNTSAYIKQDGMLLLIDCGESIFQKVIEKELLNDIDTVYILITHLHSDHCGSLSSLIFYCRFVKNIKPIIFFNDKDMIKNNLWSNNTILFEDYYLFDMNNGEPYQIPKTNISFSPILQSHCNLVHSAPMLMYDKPTIFNTYGFIINDIGKEKYSIYYSGDTNVVRSNYIEASNIIYHDACLADYEENAHTSLKKLCDLIPIEHRNKVYCMHLDCDELIEKAKVEGFNVVEVE